MSHPEFKHLSKVQLRKRVKILNVVVYLGAAIAITGFIIYFLTEYEHHWSWLLISFTYVMLSINFFMQKRRMQQEIAFREERLRKKQEGNSFEKK